MIIYTFTLIIQLISVYLLSISIHELSHYSILKLYKQNANISIGLLVSCVECLDDDIKNEKLFYAAGVVGNILLCVLFYVLNMFPFFIYELIIVFGNLCIVFPSADIYKILNLDKYIKNEKVKDIWNIVGIVISIILTLTNIVVFFVVSLTN